ncbi:MAG TPA: DUF3575 domain-containing protein [Candidatus Butyricimonas faecavium]|nr:DUF3575 domain-containing protein [Candidatus Butyricimonas faecavium]
MKKEWIVILILFSCLSFVRVNAQTIAVKTNALPWLTGTLNLCGEMRCGEWYSWELNLNYNPWTWRDNKKMKHVLIRPSFKRWFRGVYDGGFVGVQMYYSQFNIGGMPFFSVLKKHRYQGNAVGAAFSCGYLWPISASWSIEASLAAGYGRLNFKQYGPSRGDLLQDKRKENYWGVTHVGVSFVYFIQ